MWRQPYDASLPANMAMRWGFTYFLSFSGRYSGYQEVVGKKKRVSGLPVRGGCSFLSEKLISLIAGSALENEMHDTPT